MPGAERRPDPPPVGTELELTVGAVAHGGHCVARHEGQVVFVRHTLPGERVRAVVTSAGGGGRFLRADAVEVLEPAAGRVDPPCPWSGPGRCGGCDWQHVALAGQRALKAAVVTEQLARLAGLDLVEVLGRAVEVEPLPGDEEGLRWRTRIELAVGDDGRPGLRRHRSHQVVPVQDCPIATRGVIGTGVLGRRFPPGTRVDVVAPSADDAVVLPEGARDVVLREEVGGVGFEVSGRGFWQVHPGAAATFTQVVLDWLDPQPGERALDLYAGVGLFTVALAARVGPGGAVEAVEGDRVAAGHAAHNLERWPWASVRRDRVDRAVRARVRSRRGVDLVVLDPPRAGAGRQVARDVAALGARRVVYVACDPAALARDTATLAAHGYRLRDLRAFDAFPMTHHVECLALFQPGP